MRSAITPPQALSGSHARQVMKFVIPIVPVGQMRARNTARNGFAKTYKHEKQESREITLNSFLAQHQPPYPFLGALLLGVRVYLPIPASKPKKWKQNALAGTIRPVVKPDLDNAIKHLKDCMTQMRFWGDDKQVVGYLPNTGKYYSDSPRWEVEIVQL